MTTALWLLAIVVGLSVTVIGSNSAVTDATKLAVGTRLPPFFIGMTLLALGTDLPEMANSIVASYTDNGDVNVGDSLGSAITQLTLVLGVLPFAGYVIPLGDRGSRLLRGQQTTAWLTAASLIGVAVLVLDDHLRDNIAGSPNVTDFRRQCCERGMVSLREDGFKKVAEGITTIEEVLRVTESTI